MREGGDSQGNLWRGITMTYWIRKECTRKGKSHICDDSDSPIPGPLFSKSICDNEEHLEYDLVQKGIKISLVSCKDCMRNLARIVKDELRKVLEGL
jgi:hypothetical protein